MEKNELQNNLNEINNHLGLISKMYVQYRELQPLCESIEDKLKCLNIMNALLNINGQIKELIDTLENNS